MTRRIYLIFLLIMILSGCANPTATPTAFVPTKQLIEPLQPISTVMMIPSPTLEFTPTQSVLETVLKDCWFYGQPPEKLGTISPDGKWLAAGCLDLVGPSLLPVPFVKIAQINGPVNWKYSFSELTGRSLCFISPRWQNESGCWLDGYLFLDHWSYESRYVFYKIQYSLERAEPVGFQTYWGLYRVDDQTGKISAWLPFTGTEYIFSFSPDGKYLAFSSYADLKKVFINSLESGKQYVIPLPSSLGSNIIWSSDSQNIALASPYSDKSTKQDNTILYMISISDMELVSLFSMNQLYFFPVSWQSENIINLKSYDGTKSQYSQYTLYQYNLSTHELTLANFP
jgi:hypothetical protein